MRISTRGLTVSTFSCAVVGLIIVVSAKSQGKGEEACAAASQAFAIGFEGCFDVKASSGIQHKCDAHNYWKPMGSCSNPKVQTGTKFERDDFEGMLCAGGGGYYSPSFEGCMSGQYQRCETSGSWRTVGAPNGVTCK
jgi:hypothetical protein